MRYMVALTLSVGSVTYPAFTMLRFLVLAVSTSVA